MNEDEIVCQTIKDDIQQLNDSMEVVFAYFDALCNKHDENDSPKKDIDDLQKWFENICSEHLLVRATANTLINKLGNKDDGLSVNSDMKTTK